MKSRLTLRVRPYECDGNNHVNNAVYLQYLETARFEFLKDIGFDYKDMIAKGFAVYVARVEIDYKKPALVDDEILLESWSIQKRAVSGIIEQRISRGADHIAQAKVTWAFVDKTGKPARIPPEFDKEGLYPEFNE